MGPSPEPPTSSSAPSSPPHATDNILDNKQDDAGKEGKSLTGGIYFYEHALTATPKGTDKTPYPETVTYADVTYAKVYATLKPTGGRMMRSTPSYVDAYGRENKFQGRYKVYDTKEKATTVLKAGDEYGDGFNATVPEDDSVYDGRYFKVLNKEEGKEDPYLKKVYVSFLSPKMTTDIPADQDPYSRERWYWVMVPKAFYEKHTTNPSLTFRDGLAPADYVVAEDGKVKVSFQKRHYLLVHDLPGDFYMGDADLVIYDTLLAARAAGNERPIKYSRGRMVYLTPLNAQGGEGNVFNCDTRRNNIYDLVLLGIEGMGDNYDPVDPKDPNAPRPRPEDNPFEPDKPLPPINSPKLKRIRVRANVAKWNLMRHTYDLKSLAE